MEARNAEEPPSTKDQVEIVTQMILRARTFYEIWSEIKNARARMTDLEAMNRFSDFFRFCQEACFGSMVVQLHSALKKDSRTINLQSLQSISKGAIGGDSTYTEYPLDSLIPKIDRLSVLRDKIYAHRDKDITYEEAFRKANLKPNDLLNMMDIALMACNELRRYYGMQDQVFVGMARGHARGAIEGLRFPYDPAFDDPDP